MNLTRDIRYALRTLRWNPGFAAVAIIAIALGVGANTALYSILNAIWLRPLPVDKPEQLVVLSTLNTSFSYPVYRELRDRNQTLQGLIANRTQDVHIGWNGAVESGAGVLVSGNFFSVLRVGTIAGTPITPEDDVTPVSGGARGPVAVLSHSFWQRRMGGAHDVVGQRIYLNGSPLTITGIAEPGFSGLEAGISADVFAPMMVQGLLLSGNTNTMEQPLNVWLRIFGRLRPDVQSTQAAADLTSVWQQFFQHKAPNLTAERRSELAGRRVTLSDASTGISGLRRRYAQPMTILMSIAGFVLLIACANVASLLLTRATGRQREISIRLALGATRARLVSQLLVESLVIAVAGGVLGLVLARVIRDLALQFVPQSENLRVTLDVPVLGFSLLLALATGVLFGLVPSLQATSTVRPAAGASRFQLRQGLVVLQVALSLILLAGSGVFIRSLQNLTRLDPGFDRDKVLVFSINARRNGYTQDQAKLLVGRLLDRIGQLPGVKRASMADFSPLDMHTGNTIRVEGYQPRANEPSEDPGAGRTMPGYFETMSVPLLAGRDFTLHDTPNAPMVAIINEAFANHYFGDGNPIGRRLSYGTNNPFDIEIVGLVKDMKVTGLRESPVRMAFFPALQRSLFGFGGGAIHVRTTGDPAALGPFVRAEVRALDPNLPVTDMSTIGEHVDRALQQDRLIARISTLFSALALILSAVGIYGTMSYAVSRRTREIGIRMALGAERSNIAIRVIREAAALTIAGVAIGIPVAYVLLRLVSGMLFGLTPADPSTAALAIAVLGFTALVAAWVPARRASRVDPMIALRHE